MESYFICEMPHGLGSVTAQAALLPSWITLKIHVPLCGFSTLFLCLLLLYYAPGPSLRCARTSDATQVKPIIMTSKMYRELIY